MSLRARRASPNADNLRRFHDSKTTIGQDHDELRAVRDKKEMVWCGDAQRWATIREDFRHRLREKLTEQLQGVFSPIPDEIAAAIREEKRQAEALAAETNTVSAWLNDREQAAHIGELYGR